MEKERKAKMIRTCGLIFAFFFLFVPFNSVEAGIFVETFDGYSTGALSTVGSANGWTKQSAVDSTCVNGTDYLTSPYSIDNCADTGSGSSRNNNTGSTFSSTTVTASDIAMISGYLKAPSSGNDDVRIGFGRISGTNSNDEFSIGLRSSENVDIQVDTDYCPNGSAGFTPFPYVPNTWEHFTVVLDKAGGKIDFYYFDSLIYTASPCSMSSVSVFQVTASNGTANQYFIDQLTMSTNDDVEPPPPPGPPCSSGGSCILTITPDRNETVATTTATSTTFTIGVTGYVSEEDFEEGMYVEQTYYRQQSLWGGSVADSQPGLAPNSRVIQWPITAPGDFSFSTTTTVSDISGLVDSQIGEYYHKIALSYPQGFFKKVIGFFGFYTTGEELLEINTRFLIGVKSFIDTVYDDPTNFVTGGNGNPSPILDCDIDLDFNLVSCVYSLIVPPKDVMGDVWESFLENALATVPLGYVTRFATIVLSPSSVQPPPLEYTFGSSSPAVLQGKGVSFQIFDEFGVLNSIEADDGSGKTIWDIVMPFFNTVIALGVLGVILRDLLAIGVPDFTNVKRKDQEMSTKDIDNMKINDYSDATEEEWQNAKRNRLI